MAKPKPKKAKTPTPRAIANGEQFEASDAVESDNMTIGELLESRARIQRYQKWYTSALDRTEKRRETMVENLKFVSNDQWPDADKAVLGDRPCITINKSTSIIMTVSGLQRRARQEVRLLPFEPSDVEPAQLMEVLVKFTRDQNMTRAVDSRVFLNKIINGLGFWHLCYDYSRRPQGEIKLESLNPLNVFWDPNWPECEWEDCQWVIHADWWSMEEAMNKWPQHKDAIRQKFGEWLTQMGGNTDIVGDPAGDRRSFWDPETQRARILEIWYKEIHETEVAVFRDGDVEHDPAQIKLIRKALKGQPKEVKNGVVFTRQPVTFYRVAHVLDNIELDNEDSPYPFDGFPIEPSIGYYFWDHPFGMMDIMKDPQKEKNKRRSVITEIASRHARTMWLNKKGAGADPVEFERYANGVAAYIEYDEEKPIAVDPPPLDQTLVFLEKQADDELMQVVNVNDEVLGQNNSQTQSGRAIEARRQGGLITQEPLFDSFQDEQARVTIKMIEMIKENMTYEEAYRILGSLAARETDNAQQAGQVLDQGSDAVSKMLSRAFSTKYDVIITNKPYDPSFQVARFNALNELLDRMPVPPDVIVEAGIAAGIIEGVGGKRWLAQLRAAAQQGAVTQPGGGGGQPGPTTPEGVQNQVAQGA